MLQRVAVATPAIVGQHGAGEWCRVDDAVNGSVLMLQVNGAVLNAAPRVRVRAFQWCSIMRPVSVPAMVQCRRRVALASCSLQASSCASSYPCRPPVQEDHISVVQVGQSRIEVREHAT